MLLKQAKLTYTFHDPNPPDVLWKALVHLAAETAVKTVESKLKEMEERELDKIASGE